jgi:hypothetical protein
MNTHAVTLLLSQGGNPVNKEFVLDEAGKVTKRMVPNNGYFVAKTVPVPDLQAMGSVLQELAEDPSATMSLGLFKGAPDHEFIVEPYKKLARRLGVDPKDRAAWAGFHQIDGKWYVARAKINMMFSSWLLLDRDIVRDMPPELVALDRDQWLAAMARLLPGLDTAGHIIVPSSSSRVCLTAFHGSRRAGTCSSKYQIRMTFGACGRRRWRKASRPHSSLTRRHGKTTRLRSASSGRSTAARKARKTWLSQRSRGASTTRRRARLSVWCSMGSRPSGARA